MTDNALIKKESIKTESRKGMNARSDSQTDRWHKIQFRENEQISWGSSSISDLKIDDFVITDTAHGLEPARIVDYGPRWPSEEEVKITPPFTVTRRANREEVEKYNRMVLQEEEAFNLCQTFIEKFQLAMKLVKVERYFNGSKIIFYFTSDIRVDFRELVKALVQEFRIRVEMRQIGVRHETKMIGGLGCCGRELCCSSFIKKFVPVSIKMAKEQDLPLNPAKISGICNRLLCCLNYEFDAYHEVKKDMPKIGKNITLNNRTYKVLQHNVLQELVKVLDIEEGDKTLILTRKEWGKAVVIPNHPKKSHKKGSKKETS